jgi:hypothetical protein
MTLIEFKQKFPRHQLMTQMIYPRSQGFVSILCFHNYFERVLKRPMEVELYTFSFDALGKMIEEKITKVASDESVQVLVNEKIEGFGIVCCAAVPLISEEDLFNSPFVLKSPQTTGFYMLWENSSNNSVDSSHEWDAVSFSPRNNSTYSVCLPASPFVEKRSLFVYNPNPIDTVTCQFSGGFESTVSLGPMCGMEIPLSGDKKQDISTSIHGGLPAPMTIETGISGDIHVHHS